MSDDIDLGPCCICEGCVGVRNILMLHKRSPYLLGGWGCVQCGLAAEGAAAVICDACMDRFTNDPEGALRFFCRPDGEGNYMRGRARIAELDSQPIWEHDRNQHLEDK